MLVLLDIYQLIAFGAALKRILFAYILASLLGSCTSEHSAAFGPQGEGNANDESALARLAPLSHDLIKGVPEDREGTVSAKSASQEDMIGPCPFSEYHSNFSEQTHQWYRWTKDGADGRLTYSALDTKDTGSLIAGGNSFQLDTNHLDSGPLYLFAIAWTDKRLQTFPVSSFDIAGDDKRRGLGVPCINLTRGWLFIRAKSEALDLRGGELVFWFQAHDRYVYKAVNYAFTKHPIEPEALQGEFHNVCMQLTDSLDDWTCMGTNKTDQRLIYGCSPNNTRFKAVLANVVYNIGFIVRHNKHPDGSVPITESPSGSLLISEIVVSPTFPGVEKCGPPQHLRALQ